MIKFSNIIATLYSRMLACDPIDEEDGDLKSKEDREHRVVSEQDKNRVTWNIDRRCYLDQAATNRYTRMTQIAVAVFQLSPFSKLTLLEH